MSFRIGYGYDLHRLVGGRSLFLGGVPIPHEKGLDGHSDADVLLHAISDALLGSLALGDIGTHFPDTDPEWKDADSADLLRKICEMVTGRGYEVGNMDATVVAEAPRLKPYINDMRNRIAGILEIPMDRVSVKATTHEGQDAVGCGDAIASHAIVIIKSV